MKTPALILAVSHTYYMMQKLGIKEFTYNREKLESIIEKIEKREIIVDLTINETEATFKFHDVD